MFVAVARLVDPEGAGRARLLVVGGAAKSRGVVCSASYEARSFGARSGMPIVTAARLCPSATFVPVPRQACGQKSQELRRLLDRWSPRVEAASIDEFYLDLTGTEALYHHEPLDQTARRIRDDIKARSGLTLSLGGGTNRLIAKLAAERAKPRPGTGGNGVFVVPPGQEAEFVATHQLGDLPGVGPKLQAKLRSLGLISVRDALPIAEPAFQSWLGTRTGSWLYQRIRGIAGTAVEPTGDAKSISREETFAADIADPDRLDRELVRLTTRVAADLRRSGLRARGVAVKLRDDDFVTRHASRILPAACESDRLFLAATRELLTRLRERRRRPTRLLGVALSRFERALDGDQMSLADGSGEAGKESARDRQLARTIDRVNQRFGKPLLSPARLAARLDRG
jgi:DNA polymerase-4